MTSSADEAMIENLRAYRSKQAELERLRERGKAYLESVKREIESDLVALEEEVARLKASMTAFLKGEYDGENQASLAEPKNLMFKVPGLATVYLQKETQVNIEDKQAFLKEYEERWGIHETQKLFESFLSPLKVAEAVKRELRVNGEVLPGVTVEETEALAIRLSVAGGKK